MASKSSRISGEHKKTHLKTRRLFPTRISLAASVAVSTCCNLERSRQSNVLRPSGRCLLEEDPKSYEIATQFKAVKQHFHWPCNICGGHTRGVNVLTESLDGTIRVCEKCLKSSQIDERLRGKHAF